MPSSEHLLIDTPEQVALALPIAGVGSRFLALAMDTLLQGLLYLIVVVIVVWAGPAALRWLGGQWGSVLPAVGLFAAFAIYWAYFAAFEIFWKGQTPGKRLAGLRVIKDTGRPIDATAAILRNLLRAIDLLPGFYAVGVTCMLLNRHSRRLGDFAAGTVVVHDQPVERVATPWTTGTTATAGAQAARLSADELVLIETYLERRLELDLVIREQTAARIVRRIGERSGLRPAGGQSVDEFLEDVARQTRDAGRYRQGQ